jgi:hypothetical protein
LETFFSFVKMFLLLLYDYSWHHLMGLMGLVSWNLGYVLLRPRQDLNLLPDHVPKYNKTGIISYNNRNQSLSVLIYKYTNIY